MALTLLLVTVLVINRLDDYFTSQQGADLDQRAETVAKYVQSRAYEAVGPVDPVVRADGTVDPRVLDTILDPDQQRIIADELGPGRRRAHVRLVRPAGRGHRASAPRRGRP